ncbi:unnamed protein product [Ectocarpus fasciculatus]
MGHGHQLLVGVHPGPAAGRRGGELRGDLHRRSANCNKRPDLGRGTFRRGDGRHDCSRGPRRRVHPLQGLDGGAERGGWCGSPPSRDHGDRQTGREAGVGPDGALGGQPPRLSHGERH